MPKPTKEQIEAMRKLGFSDEEIADVIKSDEDIDKGKRVYFDFDKEKEKEAKKFANAGAHKAPTVYQLDNAEGKRSKKENPTKASIIQHLFKCLVEYENVTITNAERQIVFSIGENNFELTLVQKRTRK